MAIEIEQKFSCDEDFTVTELDDQHRLGRGRRATLVALYFDTPGLALARAGVTLRRRTGGSDAGWHLKLPVGGGREEVHSPIVEGSSRVLVPAELREKVAGLVGLEPLLPVVELRTRRLETPVTTPRGRQLALVADDEVVARRNGTEKSWREIEVELAGGDESDLAAISALLQQAGARPKKSSSKLAEALGLEDGVPEPAAPGRRSSAAEVLGAYIAAQVGVVQAREAGARVDAPDAVHKMRVATRRLRSTLATFADLLDAEHTEPLRAEVKWLAEQLGAPRDAEVLKARLLQAVAELPPEAVAGPVAQRLADELDAAHERSLGQLAKALDSQRHRRLGEQLVALLTDPPFLPEAEGRAPKVLARPLDKAGRRVVRRWEAAEIAEEPQREELVHEARKKAKAARYAWEAATPAFAGGRAAATAWEQVTEVLGTAQDTVVARARLLELAEVAHRAGEPTLSYGVLWQRECEQQQDARHEAAGALKAALKASRKA